VAFNHPTERLLAPVEEAVRDPSQAAIAKAVSAWQEYPYIFGPWLPRAGKDTVAVCAWAESQQPVVIRFGFDRKKLNQMQQMPGPVASFSIPVSGRPDTLFYRITVAQTSTAVYALPLNEADGFSFHVWADSQSGWDVFSRHMQNIQTMPDVFGVAVGDLVGNGSDGEEWKSFLRLAAAATARMPYFFVPGNHDYDGYYDDMKPVWFNTLFGDQPHHRMWTYANCAFISLDLHAGFPVSISSALSQGQWMLQQIRQPAWQLADWRFVFVHHPPYSRGWPGYEGELSLRQFLEPLMASAQIDFVVSGHTHDYERLIRSHAAGITTSLIVGGAGGSLEPLEPVRIGMDTVIRAHHIGRFYVRGRRIRFEATDTAGQVLDTFTRTK
jgi:hypothetical protein